MVRAMALLKCRKLFREEEVAGEMRWVWPLHSMETAAPSLWGVRRKLLQELESPPSNLRNLKMVKS